MDTTAVMGKRIGAYVIDALIGLVITIVLFFALAEQESSPIDLCALAPDDTLCVFAGETMYLADGGDMSTIFLGSFGAWFIMHAVISSLAGGSRGKLMVGLRVVDQETGQRASWGKNIV